MIGASGPYRFHLLRYPVPERKAAVKAAFLFPLSTQSVQPLHCFRATKGPYRKNHQSFRLQVSDFQRFRR